MVSWLSFLLHLMPETNCNFEHLHICLEICKSGNFVCESDSPGHLLLLLQLHVRCSVHFEV